MISPRFAPAVTILLALALIPTIRNTYVDAHVSDGRTLGAIPFDLAGRPAPPPNGGPAGRPRPLEAEDAIERRYGPDITLFAARSFDAKQLYHHPELAVAYGRSYLGLGRQAGSGPAGGADPLAHRQRRLGAVRALGTTNHIVVGPGPLRAAPRA